MVFYRFQSVVQLDMSILLTNTRCGFMMFGKDLYTLSDRKTGDDSPMEQDEVSEKVRKLKHVKVYNRLYSMIQDGVYPPGSQLPSEQAARFNELSMGMSEDWREAVCAGATMVRIGRALFSDSFESVQA